MEFFKLAVCNELRAHLTRFTAMQENPNTHLVEMEKCRRKIEELERVLEDIDTQERAGKVA